MQSGIYFHIVIVEIMSCLLYMYTIQVHSGGEGISGIQNILGLKYECSFCLNFLKIPSCEEIFFCSFSVFLGVLGHLQTPNIAVSL